MPVVLETAHALREWTGREFPASDWLTITPEKIQQFAEVTEDRQWIHVDSERAQRESPYGTAIAHGFLTLSLLSRFLGQAFQIRSGVRASINYGLNRVRFPAPVRVNSKVRARFVLQSLKEVVGALEAVFDAKLEVEGSDKPCCVAEWVLRYHS